MRSESLEFLAMILLITLTFIVLFHALLAIKEGEYHHVFALDNKTSSADFNFAAAGDWGCFRWTNQTVDNIVDKDPELVLGLGDYAYRNNATCWFQIIDPIYHKMKIALGNHDHLAYTSRTTFHPAPERLEQYMTHFNLSREYYSFNHQNVHFIAISTEVPYEAGSKQYDFIINDLQSASQNPSINWIIVYLHKPFYTSPNTGHSNTNNFTTSLRDTYHLLFDQYGVDIVLQAHVHNYQRTYPIQFNRDDSPNPTITNKNTTNYYNPKGQIFTITGTAGSTAIHNFTGPAAPYTAVQFNAYGFLDINVTHNGTVLEGNFYENNDTIKDHFTIEKSEEKDKKNDYTQTVKASMQ
jgi:hypothetical protein